MGSISTLKTTGDAYRQLTKVVTDNISNPGGIRKEAELITISKGDGIAGVKLGKVTSYVDRTLVKNTIEQHTEVSKFSALHETLGSLQNFLGQKGAKNSVAHLLQDAANSLRDIHIDPATQKHSAVSSLAKAVDTIKDWAEEHQMRLSGLDEDLVKIKDDINDKLEEVANLNMKIAEYKRSNLTTVDLENHRREQIYELSKLIDVTQVEQSDGTVSLHMCNGSPLVEKFIAYKADYNPITASAPGTPFTGFRVAGAELVTTAGVPPVTTIRASGRLYALLDQTHRDTVQPALDKIASSLDSLNTISNMHTPFKPPAGVLKGTSGHPAIDSGIPNVPGQFATTTAITTTGWLRLGIMSPTGQMTNYGDIDLNGSATVNDVITRINASAANVTASVDAEGRLNLTPNPATHSVVWGDIDGQATVSISLDSPPAFANTARGFGHFFGLRNIVEFGNNEAHRYDGVGVANRLQMNQVIKNTPDTIPTDKLVSAAGPTTNQLSKPVTIRSLVGTNAMSVALKGPQEDMTRLIGKLSSELQNSEKQAKAGEKVLEEFTKLMDEISGSDPEKMLMKLWDIQEKRTITTKAMQMLLRLETALMEMLTNV